MNYMLRCSKFQLKFLASLDEHIVVDISISAFYSASILVIPIRNVNLYTNRSIAFPFVS